MNDRILNRLGITDIPAGKNNIHVNRCKVYKVHCTFGMSYIQASNNNDHKSALTELLGTLANLLRFEEAGRYLSLDSGYFYQLIV